MLHWAVRHFVGLIVWVGIFVLALAFILTARRLHLERLVSDERLQTTSTLAHHPVSTSILIGLLFVPILLRERTEAFGWIITIVAVPALLRLIPALIPTDVRPLARGIIGIYVLARFGYMFPESSESARLLYMVAELIIVIGAVRIRNRPDEPSSMS